MSKGDSEHAAQHKHGVQPGAPPLNPQTVEQRVARLEAQVAELQKADNGGVVARLEAQVAELIVAKEEKAAGE